MQFRLVLAGSALSACLMVSAAAKAATLTGDFAAWAAAVDGYVATPDTGLPLYGTVTTIPLSNGKTLSVAGTDDTLLRPLSGWLFPWSNGYTGDIIDTTTNSETISFTGLNALGLELAPDAPFFGPFAETFTVTLSDGTTAQFSGTYTPGTTQFVGFYGSDVDSITISTTVAPDFAFGNIVDAPEPLSLSVLLAGLVGLGAVRRRA